MFASDRLMLCGLAFFVVCLSALPLGRLLLEGVAPGGDPGLDVAREVLSSKSTWLATQRSMITGIGGAVISVVLGSIFALLVALTDIRAKGPLVFCFMIPMMIPPQITALSWIQLFGPSSALLNALGIAPPLGSPHPMYSQEGIILLLGVQHAPLVFLALRAGLRSLPREMVEAARISGSGRLRVMFDVVVPLMTPPLIAGGALAFVSAIGNFGIPAMLGTPISYTTLPVLIYQRLSGFGPSIISEVAILSIIIGVIALTGLLVQSWMLSRRDYRTIGAPSRTLDLTLGRLRPVAESGCWMVIAMILIAPLLALVATSLVSAYGVRLSFETATLEAYSEVIFRQEVTGRAFRNSFILAGGAAIVLMFVAIPLGYFIAWRRSGVTRFLDIAAETPYALPGVVLAIACILIFLKPIPLLDISIYGTLWIIFAAYLGRFLTLGLRPVISAFIQTDRSLEEAAQSSGAGFLMRLRSAIAPAIAPSAAAGAILVFMTAFNELTVSALLWSSGTETLGVVVFNLDDGGYSVLASAVAVLAVIAILVLMTAVHALSGRLPKGVLPWQT
ncbi:ABC transporter permease subunit [Alphaproteobacteria bacterium HT1-32]|nr:ABC transporter permease subunit [Alphaproteobacteria bacterium HT1-32]